MHKQNNPDMVICPACVHEFPGIPENVQAELIGLRTALAAKDAEVERLRKALTVVMAARPRLTEKGWRVVQGVLGEGGKEKA